MTVYDLIGLAGVGLIVIAYVLLQTERVKYSDVPYLLANGIGAGLVLLSLIDNFNLAAAVVEAFWLVVSVYGLWRARRTEKAGLEQD